MHDTARADQHSRDETSEDLRKIAAMMFSSRNHSEPNEAVSIGKTKMKKVGGGEIGRVQDSQLQNAVLR